MDDEACPSCKTTKYRNPSLKLMVNVCGHTLCENCVHLLFVRGSGACPQCNTALRRANFRLQLFEDPYVDKEVDIRRRLYRDFNKKEEDFTTPREYNDYLEMVETVVFNIANGIELEETKKAIEQYKKENQEWIKKNRHKMGREEEELETLIQLEQQEKQLYRQHVLEEERQEQQYKQKHKEALIDELMFSDLPANHILASHKRELSAQQQKLAAPRPRQTFFSTGIRVGQRGGPSSLPTQQAAIMYVHTALVLDTCGPQPPAIEQLTQLGYLDHICSASEQDLGGGYMASVGCQRTVQDAMCSLYFNFDSAENTLSECQLGFEQERMDT